MKIILSLFLSALMLLSSAVFAEVKIGLIDMRAALFSSNAAKEFTDKMVEQFKQQDLEVRGVGEEGQKLELRLKNDAAIMSDSERSKLASDLEGKIQEYKYLKGKLDKILAAKRQEFLSESRPKLDQAINEIVQEEKLDLLLPSETALFSTEGMDFTTKIIEKLNKIN